MHMSDMNEQDKSDVAKPFIPKGDISNATCNADNKTAATPHLHSGSRI